MLAGQQDAELGELLPKLLNGAETPDHEASSAARNFQFEAVLGAQFVAGRFPVTFAEPDFIFASISQAIRREADRHRLNPDQAPRGRDLQLLLI